MRFTLRWNAGATAEIELHEPSEGGTYGLRYNSPYRSTLRSTRWAFQWRSSTGIADAKAPKPHRARSLRLGSHCPSATGGVGIVG